MLKKISLCLVAVIFFFSASTTVNAEFYNGTSEDMLESVQNYADENKIKLYNVEKINGLAMSTIIAHYGEGDKSSIAIVSQGFKNKVSFIILQCEPISQEEVDHWFHFTHYVLINLGANEEEVKNFFSELKEFLLKYNDKLITNKKIEKSDLEKTFKINCSSNNNEIYLKFVNSILSSMAIFISPYKT